MNQGRDFLIGNSPTERPVYRSLMAGSLSSTMSLARDFIVKSRLLVPYCSSAEIVTSETRRSQKREARAVVSLNPQVRSALLPRYQ